MDQKELGQALVKIGYNLIEGNKIEAIKNLRTLTNWSLVDSKNFVEGLIGTGLVYGKDITATPDLNSLQTRLLRLEGDGIALKSRVEELEAASSSHESAIKTVTDEVEDLTRKVEDIPDEIPDGNAIEERLGDIESELRDAKDATDPDNIREEIRAVLASAKVSLTI